MQALGDAKLLRAYRLERLLQPARIRCGKGDEQALLLHSVEISADR
jgi:hypothetical protein